MSRLKVIYSKNSFHVSNESVFAKFEPVFQGIYNSNSNNVSYYEVSLQLSHQSGEEFGNTDAFEFIDETTLKWMTLSLLRFVDAKSLSAPVVINTPLSSLCDAEFVEKLLEFAYLDYAISVSEINAQINQITLKKSIASLKHAGIKLWLNHYHPESSCHNSTLGVVPWDAIKVGRDLTKQLAIQHGMLQSLHFALLPFVSHSIIFDGIDNASVAEQIRPLNTMIQGVYCQYPITWSELINTKQEKDNEAVKHPLNYPISANHRYHSEILV